MGGGPGGRGPPSAPLDGGGRRSLGWSYLEGSKLGIDGTGGAVASKSLGMLLNRVEYRRFTRSFVLPPAAGGGRGRGCAAGGCGGGAPTGKGRPPELRGTSMPSLGIGPEICLGALIVGRPFRLPPLRREILFSDMLAYVSVVTVCLSCRDGCRAVVV